jgi:hypothetical protein
MPLTQSRESVSYQKPCGAQRLQAPSPLPWSDRSLLGQGDVREKHQANVCVCMCVLVGDVGDKRLVE